eukprot:TRINITY_DN103619_c0_g1_i1.p1 TRINITY_DN103619_c0_g1~~TRINITY_DN103619_c0_g1_i1.p1  ORF type:complete len:130 (+),score=11.71 TRINITY_DN103619_c0_g1_i1:784-1173(+)
MMDELPTDCLQVIFSFIPTKAFCTVLAVSSNWSTTATKELYTPRRVRKVVRNLTRNYVVFSSYYKYGEVSAEQYGSQRALLRAIPDEVHSEPNASFIEQVADAVEWGDTQVENQSGWGWRAVCQGTLIA